MIVPLASLFGPENWMLIAMVGLLLFGKRMPEVGRSLGKGIVEFKKGLAGIEEDVTQAGQRPLVVRNDLPALSQASAGYKFDPYTGKPVREDEEAIPHN
jgi:sec-independent protein translocase protein TatA